MRSTDFQRQDKVGEGLRKKLKFGCGPCSQWIFRDKIKWVRDLEKYENSAAVFVVNRFSEKR